MAGPVQLRDRFNHDKELYDDDDDDDDDHGDDNNDDDEHGDASDFLRDIELSTRQILRSNNARRMGSAAKRPAAESGTRDKSVAVAVAPHTPIRRNAGECKKDEAEDEDEAEAEAWGRRRRMKVRRSRPTTTTASERNHETTKKKMATLTPSSSFRATDRPMSSSRPSSSSPTPTPSSSSRGKNRGGPKFGSSGGGGGGGGSGASSRPIAASGSAVVPSPYVAMEAVARALDERAARRRREGERIVSLATAAASTSAPASASASASATTCLAARVESVLRTRPGSRPGSGAESDAHCPKNDVWGGLPDALRDSPYLSSLEKSRTASAPTTPLGRPHKKSNFSRSVGDESSLRRIMTPRRPFLSKRRWKAALEASRKVDMTTAALWKKYRCEQCRVDAYRKYLRDKRLREDAKRAGFTVGEVTDAGKSERRSDVIQGGIVSVAEENIVENHPIHARVFAAIDRANRRSRARTAEWLKGTTFSTNLRALWNEETDIIREKEDGTPVIKDVGVGGGSDRDESISSPVISSNKIMSTTKDKDISQIRVATDSKMAVEARARGPLARGFEGTKSSEDTSVLTLPATEQAGSGRPPRSSRPIYPHPPESFLLAVDEPILAADKREVMASISLIRLLGDGGGEDYPDAVVGNVWWRVAMYDPSNISERVLLLNEVEVHRILASLAAPESTAAKNEERELVHCQILRRVRPGGAEVEADCKVFMGVENGLLKATIALRGRDGEGRGGSMDFSYANSYDDPSLYLTVYAYEIIVLLRMQPLLRAFDAEFWKRKTNGEAVWSPLLELLEIQFGSGTLGAISGTTWSVAPSRFGPKNFEGVEGSLREGDVEPSGVDWARVDWEQSELELDVNRLLSSVRTAYDLIVRLPDLLKDERTSYEDEERAALLKSFERARENIPPLSMRAAARELINSPALCPGCTPIGRKGLWWASGKSLDEQTPVRPLDDTVVERTQVVSRFVKGSSKGPFPGPVVISALALESSILAPKFTAWESSVIIPPPAVDELVSGPIPHVIATSDALLKNPLRSELDTRIPPTILILNPASQEKDWISFDAKMHRRKMDELNRHGFRVKCWGNLIVPDASIPRHVYGVTERGATPNRTDVHRRQKHHSEQCCTKYLSRKRGPMDYFYILKNEFTDKDGGSPNEPSLFTVLMDAYKVGSIIRTTEKDQRERQANERRKREDDRKKAALAAKIKAATELLERKALLERDRMLRQESNHKEDAHSMHRDGLGHKNDEEHDYQSTSWTERMYRSVIVSVQDFGRTKWEERIDLEDRRTFYRNTDPAIVLENAARWDPPVGWREASRPYSGDSSCVEEGKGKDGIGGVSVTSQGSLKQKHDDRRLNDKSTEQKQEPEGEESYSSREDDIERVADLLCKNEKFVKTIAKKLGVSESCIKNLLDDISKNKDESDASKAAVGIEIVRNKTNVTTDEVTGSLNDIPVTSLVQDYSDLYAQKLVELRSQKRGSGATSSAEQLAERNHSWWEMPEEVMNRPDLADAMKGYEWRRLPKAIIGEGFFDLNRRKIQRSPENELFNRCNDKHIVGLVNSAKVIRYEVDGEQFQAELRSILIKDISADRMKVAADAHFSEENEDSLLNVSQQNALEKILKIPLGEIETKDESSPIGDSSRKREGGSVDREEAAREGGGRRHRSDDGRDDERREPSAAENEARLLLAVKNANYMDAEEFLDDVGIPIETKDSHGNTLFISACQQGNKKMAKFLLRRGAEMNAQNYAGKTALHYLYEYRHIALAEYLIKKGADDSLLSADGLTCYEMMCVDDMI